MRLKQNPFHLFLFAALLLILTSFVVSSKESIDIQVHDTYFVIAKGHFHWLFAIVLWAFWLLYLLSRRWLLSKRLTWIHVVLTLATLAFFLYCIYAGSNPQRYLDYYRWNTFNSFRQNSQLTAYTMLALLSAQLIFFINLFAGLGKWLTQLFASR